MNVEIIARGLHANVHRAAGRDEHQLVVGRQRIHELLQAAAYLRQRLERRLAVVDHDDDPHRIASLCPLLRGCMGRRNTSQRERGEGEKCLSHRAEN